MRQFFTLFLLLTLLGWIPAKAQLLLSMPDVNVECSDTIDLPVTVNNFSTMVGLQFSVNWSPAQLKFLSVGNFYASLNLSQGQNFGVTQSANGILTFAWNSTDQAGNTLPSNAVLFTIKFKALGSVGAGVNVLFSNNSTPIEATVAPFTIISVTPDNGLVTIVDTHNPVLTCPANVVVNAPNGSQNVVVNNIAPTASDNCGAPTVTYALSGANTGNGNNNASGTPFNVGTTTVTYSATDLAPHTTTCAFTVTVNSSTPSVDTLHLVAGTAAATCQQTFNIPITVSNFTNVQSLQFSVNWNNNVIHFDSVANYNLPGLDNMGFGTTLINNGILSFVWSDAGNDGETVPNGTVIFRIYFSVAASGGATTAIFFSNNNVTMQATEPGMPPAAIPFTTQNGIVNVTDNTAPVVTCPASITVNAGSNSSASVNNISPIATDNCGTPIVLYTKSGATTGNGATDASGTSFNIGSTTVVYTARDQSLNTSSCSFTVTVINMPTDTTLSLFAEDETDNCGAELGINIYASNFVDLTSLQFSLHWDTTVLKYNSIGNLTTLDGIGNGNYGFTQTDNGILTFAWVDPNLSGETLADSSILFTVFLKLKPTNAGSATVSFSNTPTSIEGSALGFPPVNINIVTENGVITIVDHAPPTLTCPADLTVTAPFGNSSTAVNGIGPIAEDNCGIGNVIYFSEGATSLAGPGDASAQTFNVGITTVTYHAEDFAGNTATCSFQVTVQEQQVLTLIAQTDTVDCSSGDVSIDISAVHFTQLVSLQFSLGWNNNIINFSNIDNLNPLLNLSLGSNFGLGQTSNGKLSFSWFDVPSVTLPADAVLFTLHFSLAGNGTGATPISINNSPVSIEAAMDGFPVLTVPVDTIPGSVVIDDMTAPVNTNCPADIISNAIQGQCSRNVSWIEPTFTDACDNNLILFQSHFPGDNFGLGVTTITYYAIDNNGNIATCSFIVRVKETDPPVFNSCPTNIVAYEVNACGVNVSFQTPVATDLCDTLVAVIASHASGSFFPTGSTTVFYTATDDSNNTAICSFTINVLDTLAPVIQNCPADITVYVTSALCGSTANWDLPTASDNCNNFVFDSDGAPEDTFAIGFNPIHFTATDPSGNSSTCTFSITVLDTFPPEVAFCPSNITVSSLPDTCGAFVDWSVPVFTDNCTVDLSLQSDHNPGSFFPLGTTSVHYSGFDGAGNSTECNFGVQVNDHTPPHFPSCPQNVTINLPPTQCDTVYTWVIPNAIDACNGNITTVASHLPGQHFQAGNTIVTYTSTDAAGNTGACTFVITVIDQTPLTVSECPNAIQVGTLADTCGNFVSWNGPIFQDDCSPIIVNSNHTSGDFFATGTYTVLVTGTDLSGNTATCSFTVTVNDTIAPIAIDCPANLFYTIPGGACDGTSFAWPEPIFDDNCQPFNLSISLNIAPGSFFPVGVTNVVYTATDPSNNTGYCIFDVSIMDESLPVLSPCPDDIVMDLNGVCEQLISWDPPTATDSCTVDVIITTTNDPNTLFSAGTTVVTYTASDAGGNTATCSFQVVLNESVAPEILGCPADLTVSVASGCQSTADWTLPIPIDNCDTAPLLVSNYEPGDTFPTGITQVIYTATDHAGNSAQCSFSVFVSEAVSPVFLSACPSNYLGSALPDSCGNFVTWDPPLISDNCGEPTLTSNFLPGDFFPVGFTSVVYTVSDASGNTATCSFMVLLTDASGPQLQCPEILTVSTDPDTCGAFYAWPQILATDNCTTVGDFMYSQEPGSFFPSGCTFVNLTVFDGNGNFNECYFQVCVVDSVPPVVSCPANLTVDVQGIVLSDPDGFIDSIGVHNCDNIELFYNGVFSALDNCSGALTAAQSDGTGLVSGSSFPVGTVELQFSSTDGAGNVGSCSFLLTVFGMPDFLNVNAAPNPACVGSTVFLHTDQLGPDVIYQWEGPNQFSAAVSDTFITNFDLPNVGVYTVTATDVYGCTSEGIIQVSIAPPPNLGLSANDLPCSGGELNLMAVDSNDVATTWYWTGPADFTDTVQNATILNATAINAGVYTLIACNAAGCCDTASIEVMVTGSLTGAALSASDSTICFGSPVTLTGTEYPGAVYHWFATPENGSGLPADSTQSITITPNTSGTYTFGYYASFGDCVSDTALLDITVQTVPLIDASYNEPINCLTDTTVLHLFETGGEAISWEWSGPADFTSTEHNPIIDSLTAANAGLYWVTVTDAGGCTTSASVDIQFATQPAKPLITANEDYFCLGSPIQLFTDTVTNGVFVWTGPNFSSADQNPVVTTSATILNTGNYVLVVVVNGCASPPSDTLSFDILDQPSANADSPADISNSGVVSIDILGNDAFVGNQPMQVTFVIPPGHGTVVYNNDGTVTYNPADDYQGSESFIYSLCYKNCPESCDTAIVRFTVTGTCDFIPNLFTPNDDGINDEFFIPCIQGGQYGNNELLIFNEWGDQVFSASPYGNDWKGTYKGKDLPDGTYFYMFRETKASAWRKGYLTLFR